MPDKKKKTTVREAVDKGGKVADVVKEFTPDSVDRVIDQGKQLAEVGTGLLGIFKGFGSMFSRKKK